MWGGAWSGAFGGVWEGAATAPTPPAPTPSVGVGYSATSRRYRRPRSGEVAVDGVVAFALSGKAAAEASSIAVGGALLAGYAKTGGVSISSVRRIDLGPLRWAVIISDGTVPIWSVTAVAAVGQVTTEAEMIVTEHSGVIAVTRVGSVGIRAARNPSEAELLLILSMLGDV